MFIFEKGEEMPTIHRRGGFSGPMAEDAQARPAPAESDLASYDSVSGKVRMFMMSGELHLRTVEEAEKLRKGLEVAIAVARMNSRVVHPDDSEEIFFR